MHINVDDLLQRTTQPVSHFIAGSHSKMHAPPTRFAISAATAAAAPARGDLLVNLALGATLLWLPLSIAGAASVGRACIQGAGIGASSGICACDWQGMDVDLTSVPHALCAPPRLPCRSCGPRPVCSLPLHRPPHLVHHLRALAE